MKKISKKQIILLIIFILMLILNYLTPLIIDDYYYLLKFNSSEKIKNILDIVIFQKEHYLNWGGRLLAHSIAQIFLIMPKFIFNICNSLIFVIEIILIYKIVTPPKNKQYYLILTFFLIWFFNPVFGQVNLWLIGSCNYLWTMCIMLFYMYLFENYEKKRKNNILISVFGLLAGMCNENTSLAILCMMTIRFLFIDKTKYKYKLLSIILCTTGYIFQIMAPGNFTRVSNYANDSIINNFIINCNNLYKQITIPIFIISLFFLLNKKYKKICIYHLGIIISIYSLIITPTQYIRNFYSAIIFLIIIILILVKDLNIKILKNITIAFTFIFIFQYIYTVKDFIEFHNFFNNRITQLKKATSTNKKEIYLKVYHSDNTKIPLSTSTDIDDLLENPNKYPNNIYKKYFNIKVYGYEEKYHKNNKKK